MARAAVQKSINFSQFTTQTSINASLSVGHILVGRKPCGISTHCSAIAIFVRGGQQRPPRLITNSGARPGRMVGGRRSRAGENACGGREGRPDAAGSTSTAADGVREDGGRRSGDGSGSVRERERLCGGGAGEADMREREGARRGEDGEKAGMRGEERAGSAGARRGEGASGRELADGRKEEGRSEERAGGKAKDGVGRKSKDRAASGDGDSDRASIWQRARRKKSCGDRERRLAVPVMPHNISSAARPDPMLDVGGGGGIEAGRGGGRGGGGRGRGGGAGGAWGGGGDEEGNTGGGDRGAFVGGMFVGVPGDQGATRVPRLRPLALPAASPDWTYREAREFTCLAGGEHGLLSVVDARTGSVALAVRMGEGEFENRGTVDDSLNLATRNILLRWEGRVTEIPALAYAPRASLPVVERRPVVIVANRYEEPLFTVYTEETEASRTIDGGGRQAMVTEPHISERQYGMSQSSAEMRSGVHDALTVFGPSVGADRLHHEMEQVSMTGLGSGGVPAFLGRMNEGRRSSAAAAMPAVHVYSGVVDGLYSGADVTPLLSLNSSAAGDIRITPLQEKLRDANGQELAVVTHELSPVSGRPDFLRLLLHPGADVTLVAVILAARSWLVSNLYVPS